jgi:hypothetical protein
MFDAVKRKLEWGQEPCNPFDGSPALVGKAALRVLGLRFGRSVLDQVELQDLSLSPSV